MIVITTTSLTRRGVARIHFESNTKQCQIIIRRAFKLRETSGGNNPVDNSASFITIERHDCALSFFNFGARVEYLSESCNLKSFLLQTPQVGRTITTKLANADHTRPFVHPAPHRVPCQPRPQTDLEAVVVAIVQMSRNA